VRAVILRPSPVSEGTVPTDDRDRCPGLTMTSRRPGRIPTPIGLVVLADLPPTDPGFAPPDVFAQQHARELWALHVRGQVLDQLLDGTVRARAADRVLAAVDRVLRSPRRGRRPPGRLGGSVADGGSPGRVIRVKWPSL
jgi:hypothetical protein